MSTITTDDTIKYAKHLNILYVEDDVELQQQTKEFLEILFHSVITTNNGKEALEKYLQNEFDIVISDIKMPVMNGIELTKEIKRINPNQVIIITSAYNDIEYLTNFINLNIKQFMQKPIRIENMLNVLYDTSKNIVNDKMIETYRKELEVSNKSLQEKNEELQSLIRILDSKLIQLSKESNINNINVNELQIRSSDLEELQELETDISGAAVLISLSTNLTVLNIEILGNMFKSYSNILSHYEEFKDLNISITCLGNILMDAPQNFIQRVEDISILLESFIYVLRMWRKNVVENEIKKAFELHTSMINDVNTIIAIIDGTENEIEGEMEFF